MFKYKTFNKYFASRDDANDFRINYNIKHGLMCNMYRLKNNFYELQVGDGLVSLIDIDDFHLIATKQRWRRHYSPNRHGLVYVESTDHVKLHRLITNFRWKEVDHINRNGLDNRKANLRDGTNVNSKNRRLFQNNKSGKNGVLEIRYKNQFMAWKVVWRENGKQHSKNFSKKTYGSAMVAFEAAKNYRTLIDIRTDNRNGYEPQQ